ncbi:hypothetical protein BpHYR1_034308 [Brachionus plicatilis]|uniref:Uncharacterized protein n=1 Tax=Brachionus plicatilis TaxID=10195 RepID=A0A3M7RVF5_BRAPC|nr:hypothetical protein BpHYR1_034308 [Brachionus plicatilis]
MPICCPYMICFRKSALSDFLPATNEDIFGGGVQHPVVAFARVIVVADGILPALFVLFVVGIIFDDELVDAVQCEPFLGVLTYGHHYESVVAVRWLDAVLVAYHILFCAGLWAFFGIVFALFAAPGLGVRVRSVTRAAPVALLRAKARRRAALRHLIKIFVSKQVGVKLLGALWLVLFDHFADRKYAIEF